MHRRLLGLRDGVLRWLHHELVHVDVVHDQLVQLVLSVRMLQHVQHVQHVVVLARHGRVDHRVRLGRGDERVRVRRVDWLVGWRLTESTCASPA